MAGCLLRVALHEAIPLLRSYQLGKSTGATNIQMPVIHTKLSDFIQTTKFRKYPYSYSYVTIYRCGSSMSSRRFLLMCSTFTGFAVTMCPSLFASSISSSTVLNHCGCVAMGIPKTMRTISVEIARIAMFMKITSIFNYLQFARFSNKISTNRKRQPPEMDDCRCFLLLVVVLALNLHALDSFLCQL